MKNTSMDTGLGEWRSRAVLDLLDLGYKSSGTGWATAKCPLHDDKNPSLSINLRNSTCKCWAEHCLGDEYSSLFFLAVAMREHGTPIDLREVENILTSVDIEALPVKDEELLYILRELDPPNPPDMEQMLQNFLPYGKRVEERGISREAAEFYGLRYDMEQDRIIIPITDHQGIVRGIDARHYQDDVRYSPVVKSRKSNWVWGAHKFLYQNAVVFEGALGAARAKTLLPNLRATALLTSNVSNAQLIYLSQLNHVTLALDPDSAGWRGSKKSFAKVFPHTSCDVIALSSDIDEITAEELTNCLENPCTIDSLW